MICDITQYGRHFRDRAVGQCHKRRDPPERIDSEIALICLPAPLDADSLVGETALFESNVGRKCARTCKIVELHDRGLHSSWCSR